MRSRKEIEANLSCLNWEAINELSVYQPTLLEDLVALYEEDLESIVYDLDNGICPTKEAYFLVANTNQVPLLEVNK